MKTLNDEDLDVIRGMIDNAIFPMVQSLSLVTDGKGQMCVVMEYVFQKANAQSNVTDFIKRSCTPVLGGTLPLPRLPELPASLVQRMTDSEKNAWSSAVAGYQQALTLAIRGKA